MRAWHAQAGHQLYLPQDPAAALATAEKVAWLERVDREARRLDPRVVHVSASLVAVHEVVLIATSEGELAADVRPLVRFNVSVLVEQNGRREQGYAGAGGRYSLAELVAGERPLALAREAVRQALLNLEAVPAPAGTMTVVLGPGWPGILLHEAIGHGLEGDFNRKGTSAFAGRIGERVAAPECTVVDDGTLSRRRGSLNIDDEGTPTRCTTLIENGVLRGYMQDRLNARLMGVRADRQRPPRVVRASDPAAHDQYLHAPGAARARGDHPLRRARHLCGQLRRRPGGHHLGQVRVLRERGVRHRERPDHHPAQGRHAHRQRPGRAHARHAWSATT